MWDLNTGQCIRTFRWQFGKEVSVAISYDGRFGLSGDGLCFRLWNLTTGQCLKAFSGSTHRGAVSADGKLGFFQSGKRIELWNLTNGQCLRALEVHMDDATSIAVSADGEVAVSNYIERSSGLDMGRRTVSVWKVANGQCLRVLEGHTRAHNLSCHIR